MPIITRSVDDGLFNPKMLFIVLADLRETVRPRDQQDAFWLIHPRAWEEFATSLSSPTHPVTPWRPLADEPRRTIQDDPHPPNRLLGLPLHIRDEGQDWREVQIWAENHIERAVRRNPGITVSVPEFVVPVESPPVPPPTLRALLRKWLRRR